MNEKSAYKKMREKTIESFLKSGENSLWLTSASSIPENTPEALIFTQEDSRAIASILADSIKKGMPVKRIIVQSCSELPFLRGWLKDNGYIIYGERLWAENDSLCHTAAAVWEASADEEEKAMSYRAFAAEAYIYGTEELYNEVPLMLWLDNNDALPQLLYEKLTETENIIADISGITADDSELPDELKAKKHAALLKKQQLSIMVNCMYPID